MYYKVIRRVLQYGLFCDAKEAILGRKRGFFALQYSLFWKWMLYSQYFFTQVADLRKSDKAFFWRRPKPCQKMRRPHFSYKPYTNVKATDFHQSETWVNKHWWGVGKTTTFQVGSFTFTHPYMLTGLSNLLSLSTHLTERPCFPLLFTFFPQLPFVVQSWRMQQVSWHRFSWKPGGNWPATCSPPALQ